MKTRFIWALVAAFIIPAVVFTSTSQEEIVVNLNASSENKIDDKTFNLTKNNKNKKLKIESVNNGKTSSKKAKGEKDQEPEGSFSVNNKRNRQSKDSGVEDGFFSNKRIEDGSYRTVREGRKFKGFGVLSFAKHNISANPLQKQKNVLNLSNSRSIKELV